MLVKQMYLSIINLFFKDNNPNFKVPYSDKRIKLSKAKYLSRFEPMYQLLMELLSMCLLHRRT